MWPETSTDQQKINFNPRIAEAWKDFSTKKQIENAVDLEDKNWQKNFENQKFDLYYFISKSCVDDDGSQN